MTSEGYRKAKATLSDELFMRSVWALEGALEDLLRVSSQYLDTGRGDLDGFIEHARATLATVQEGVAEDEFSLTRVNPASAEHARNPSCCYPACAEHGRANNLANDYNRVLVENMALREAVEAARDYLETHWAPTGTAQGNAAAGRLRAAFRAVDEASA